MMTTVMRYSVTSHDVTVDGPSTITVRHGRRYSQGWRSAEQDRKPAPNVARIISQDYSVIKRECLSQKALWEDPNFPATDQSIYPSSHGPLPFKWTRASVGDAACNESVRREKPPPPGAVRVAGDRQTKRRTEGRNRRIGPPLLWR